MISPPKPTDLDIFRDSLWAEIIKIDLIGQEVIF